MASLQGRSIVRREDRALLTRGGTYVADVADAMLDGAGHVIFVRSTMAHARITGIDVEGVRTAPGVVGVFTAADLDLGFAPMAVPVLPPAMARPWLAGEVVRFVGEPIVMIVTERRDQGEDAAEQAIIDYEPLPVVAHPEDARDDEVLLFPDHGSNTAAVFGDEGDASEFADCEVVVRERLVNQRVAVAPLEVRSTAAAVGADGRLNVWMSTQAPQSARHAITRAFGWELDSVRVVAPDVGGGFGAKIGPYPEEMLVAWLARHLGRPLRWLETRSENMVAMGHGRGQIQHVTIGGSRDGAVLAYRLDILQDSGAYPSMGAFLPYMTRVMAAGVYAIPSVACHATSVVTNTMTTVAYRGAGRPEATAAIERAMDLFAAEIGMSPAEVRRRNLIDVASFPHTTPTGAVYDIGDYRRALDLVLDAAGYDELLAEQASRRASGSERQIGIGLALYVEITAGPTAGKETARVEIRPDGRAMVFTGTSPHGQGHETSWAMIASDVLGIGLDDIEVIHGDTDLVPRGMGTMGSRSLQLGGSAVLEASEQVLDLARRVAAELLGVGVDDVVLDHDAGVFREAHDAVSGTSVSWQQVAVAAAGEGGSLAAGADFQASTPTYPFGAHVAVVELDSETGLITLDRFIAVDDAGRVLNPLIAEGQRHGGIAQGAAQALCEEMVYDDDANPLTTTFADYTFISACELPSFELVAMETPTPVNPLGAKGVGESGTIGSTPAVQNAVVDALSPWGVRHLDMPATPQRVWRAIAAGQDLAGRQGM